MPYPLRFFGCGVPLEVDGVVIPARCSVEVTFRVFDQQFLMRPDEETIEIIGGCFGRALHRYPDLNLHAVSALSNHGCFLATPASAAVLSDFMRDLKSTMATRLNLRHDREGTFWERRYRAIPAVDEASVEGRLRYVLTQGTKENLVMSAREWPGFSSVAALTRGEPLVGRWRDHATEYELRRRIERRQARARARGEELVLEPPAPVYIEYPIEHKPLPHWQHLSPDEQRANIEKIIADDDRLTAERHRRDGTRPLGVRAVLATDPFDRPEDPARSPAPLCHASTKSAGRAYRKAYNGFVESVRTATESLEDLMPMAAVPPGATLRPLTHQPDVSATPASPPDTSSTPRASPIPAEANTPLSTAAAVPGSRGDPPIADAADGSPGDRERRERLCGT